MSWYKTGQINITNGSQTVVGVGTNFARFVESGEALLAPDGKHYEIATVLSATELRLVSSYTGATASAQSYAIVPVQGYVRDLAYKAADLIDAHKSIPEEALAHAEAAEQSAVRAEAAKVGLEDAKTQAESSAAAAASSATAAQGSKNSAATSAQAAQSSATAAATSATAAASSASAAASSKSAAATSESAALASKNAAATSASAAATSASAAATSASAAATSATAAEQSKIASATYESDARASRTGAEAALAGAVTAKNEASASQTSAKTSMDAAAASSASASASSAAAAQHRDKAKDWADKTGGEVEAGKYSARYWAELASSITTGGVIYMGTWSAQTGAYPATPSRGHLYKVSTAGTVGGVAYSVKDMIIYNGESWDKIDTTDEVTSVAGKVGAVTLTNADVGLGNVDNTSDANKPVSTATQAALDTKAPVSHTHDASAIVSGTIADDRLPARLREKPQAVTDWNTAVASGWYQGNEAANAPSTGNFIGNVECHHERWVTQVVHLFTADSEEDTKTYRRESSDASGVAAWGPWYRLRLSEAEQAAVTQAWWDSTAVPISKVAGLQTTLDTKVDKVAGKQLSTEDYTTAEKSKLSGVAAGANNYSHPEGDGNKHVPATGTTNDGKVLKAGSTAGSAAWGNVDYSEVTGKPVLGTAASRDVSDLLAKMPVNISGATTDFNSLTLSGLYNLYNTQSARGAPPFSYGVMFVIGSNRVGSTFAAQIAIDKATGDTYTRGQNDTSTDWSAWQKGWNSNNDGAGSGLDSDLLDGQHGSFYQNASNLTTGTVPEPRIPALPISKITDLQTALNGKQASLGFTPVQQGGPAGYGTSKVYIGWATDGSGLLCQVDGTNFGKSWPINVTGTAARVVNPYVSPAVEQTGDIGAAFVNWSTSAIPALQLNTPNSDAAYMVWRATRWGARHVAAMHVYEGSMVVTMSVGNLNNFTWDGSGNFTATGNVNALSDIRLKTDLTKIEGALEKVCAINGYTYTRKDTGARQTGVVAQEVQKVLPEAVMDNGENLAVAYGNMVGLLIEAIKELKAEVDQLKGK